MTKFLAASRVAVIRSSGTKVNYRTKMKMNTTTLNIGLLMLFGSRVAWAATTHDLGVLTVTLHPIQFSGGSLWQATGLTVETFSVVVGDHITGKLRFSEGKALQVSDRGPPFGGPPPFSTRSAGVGFGGFVDGLTYETTSFSTFTFYRSGGDLEMNPTASGSSTHTSLNFQGVGGSVGFGQPGGTSLLAGWDFDVEITSLPLPSFELGRVSFNIAGAIAIVPETNACVIAGFGAAAIWLSRQRLR